MTERRPNYVGIVAGAIVMFLFGAIWFTVFGAAWLASVGKSKDELMATGFWPYIISFIAGLLVSYCFDNMLWHYERADAMKGAQVGHPHRRVHLRRDAREPVQLRGAPAIADADRRRLRNHRLRDHRCRGRHLARARDAAGRRSSVMR